MNLKKLFIIRHGQTDYNLNGMVQGSGIDAPLNDKGRQQAEQFFKRYQLEPFEKIYISKLQRTYQSVDGFIRNGIPYEQLSGLNEISWGSQEGKPFTEETSRLYHDTVAAWSRGHLGKSVGGGESPLDVMARQQEAINHILSRQSEKHVLICMHGRAMRILLTWMIGRDLSEMDRMGHSNLGLYEVHVRGQHFEIIRENDIAHLFDD